MKKKIPSIKKDIKAFLTSEEGKISKKSSLELGVGVAILGAVLSRTASATNKDLSQDVSDDKSKKTNLHSSHESYLSKGSGDLAYVHASSCGGGCSHTSHVSHTSHGSHTSHSSHSSHSSHGSHGSHSSHGSHGSHSSHSSHGSHGSHSSHGSHGSHSSHTSCSGGCSGCPFISVWNGKRFIIENNILPGSEDVLRKNTVMEEFYKIETVLKSKNKKYLFRVIELEQEHSYFHNFELVRIIHPTGSNIGVVDNKIVVFNNLILPSLIEDKKGKNWTKKLSSLNDKMFFAGEEGDILTIKFRNIQNLKKCHLIFRASLRSNYLRTTKIERELEKAVLENKMFDFLKKVAVTSIAMAKVIKAESVSAGAVKSIHLSVVRIGKNKKNLINIIHPREKLSLGLADISQYVKGQKSLSLNLEWTNSHNLSFTGLATTSDLSEASHVSQKTIQLSSLSHSEKKNINKNYLKSGKVELTPGQYIELEFPVEKDEVKVNQKTSFVLKSKGYYTAL